ncbi:T9SS type A sorting domain-containing protein [Mangrovibacterium sp.]|uniref:T9SS type A sorting domain-containing protein n=1 Tax=Mangrovibacterium sp. TaxID=1961364 RepID=UPI003562303D
MKHIFSTILILTLFLSADGESENKHPLQHEHPPICRASKEVHRHFIPPPNRFQLKSAQTTAATINVTYTGFTTEAQTAFAYAVNIWEGLIKSPVTINMKASWSSLDDNILGNCSPSDYLENFDGAPLNDYYYPIALAEKLAGKKLNESTDPDIIAQFNSNNSNWYFGTDGNTPSDKYDFVSVVLHEIGHGLGFTGLCYETAAELGAYGWITDHPGIFDDYMINFDGQQLVDQSLFPNFSAELFDEFESGYLEFQSEWALSQLNGSYPRLYAPLTYEEGSSLYHLNESTYSPTNANSLMTPAIGLGEAIHDPGPATLAIFEEMGWVYTSISHTELTDTEDTTSPLTVFATVVSDEGLDSSTVKLIYTLADFNEADTILMNYTVSTDEFTAQLPITGEGEIRYYLAASDLTGRVYRLPRQSPDDYFNVLVGPDQTPPTITHDPVKILLESDQNLQLSALATDNIGVAEVQVEYSVNQNAVQKANLDLIDGSYSTTLNFAGLTDGDSIRYRLIATDASTQQLSTNLPTAGYFKVTVEGFYSPVNTYSNNFNDSSKDFISTSFYIGLESGFDNGALHSPHPYSSPMQNSGFFNFVSVLKYPIILQADGMLSFNEVVLVEPGENGAVFGDDNFWDYVIIEGSLDGETNWLPLVDGYDSNANASWETTYNSLIVGDNSTAIGQKELFINRQINLTGNGNFSAGQTIYIRFRLFADPYANGWGWAIDDLVIQDTETASNQAEISPGEILIYPNPVRDILQIEGHLNQSPGQIQFSIRSSTGQILSEKTINGQQGNFSETFDFSTLPTGIYLLLLQFENGGVASRKIIRQ